MSSVTAHLESVHIVYVDRPDGESEEIFLAGMEDVTAEIGRLSKRFGDAHISVRDFLVDGSWSADSVRDRLERDLDARHFDDSECSVMPGAGTDTRRFALHVSVNPAPANLEVLQSRFGDVHLAAFGSDVDAWASAHRVGRRDAQTCRATVRVESRRGDVVAVQRTVRELYRDGAIEQGLAGIVAMCTDLGSDGLGGTPARFFYSCDNCFDVFEDLSCPNDKRACVDCCGDGH